MSPYPPLPLQPYDAYPLGRPSWKTWSNVGRFAPRKRRCAPLSTAPSPVTTSSCSFSSFQPPFPSCKLLPRARRSPVFSGLLTLGSTHCRAPSDRPRRRQRLPPPPFDSSRHVRSANAAHFPDVSSSTALNPRCTARPPFVQASTPASSVMRGHVFRSRPCFSVAATLILTLTADSEKKMPVRLRLQRLGRTHAPVYRVVAADSRAPRDGRFIEIVGTYNPRPDEGRVHRAKSEGRGKKKDVGTDENGAILIEMP